MIEIPGRAVGMNSAEPSNNGGMNWLPNLKAERKSYCEKHNVRRDCQPSMAQAPPENRQI